MHGDVNLLLWEDQHVGVEVDDSFQTFEHANR